MAHKELHKKLGAQVVEILLAHKKGHRLDAHELIDFLTDWLIHHIVQDDKRSAKAAKLFPGRYGPGFDLLCSLYPSHILFL